MHTYITRLFANKSLFICFLLLLFASVNAQQQNASLLLTQRQMCDLELIMSGGFDPLKTFMNQADYENVVHNMRLSNGRVWPMPIVLDVREKDLAKVAIGSTVALKDQEGFVLATIKIEEIWMPNKVVEAEKVFKTTDTLHPGVDYLFNRTGEYYVSGPMTFIQAPEHFDFTDLRRTPAQLKQYFKDNGIETVVAFQTRNPMHRAHLELTMRAAKKAGAHLLINPSVGMTKPGDVDYFTRVKCYKKLLNYFPEGSATLNLLPLAMRMGGPREALWHAIIRKNHGCTHFIVGRDHAGPGKDSNGVDFYGPYDSQEMVKKYADEIGIKVVTFMEVVYVKEDKNYQPVDEIAPGKTIGTISGTQLRKLLNEGAEIPEWFSFPEVVTELRKVYPPRHMQGYAIFFTGLSGSGKSTLAKALALKLSELQERPVTLLDGDVIRNHLTSELGFSREHRALNVRRVGYVASEIAKHRGIAICSLIAPYEIDRNYNRELVNNFGNFIEIHISTPLDVCAERDTKGLYALAKAGKLKGMTGVDDPYEDPTSPEISIDTSKCTVSEAVNLILRHLKDAGHLLAI